jgi:hypothetical protein
VITPEVTPERRRVFIDMMRSMFRQKNGSTVTAGHQRTRHHMTSAAEMVLGTERNWELEIWELSGPPETWEAQLAARYRDRPVFALLSGLGNASWQPVHDFCHREQVPCWFPSVELPGRPSSDYAFYFSGGVTLEAGVLARHLVDHEQRPRRLLQIYREGVVGRAAAQTVHAALHDGAPAVMDQPFAADASAADGLAQAIAALHPGDAVMFWLRPEDLQALSTQSPVPGVTCYFSALLGGAEQMLLPDGWRAGAHLVYPYELPDRRTWNLDYFHAWLALRNLPLIDEAMQSEAFFAVNFMTDTLSEMLDNLYREYLVERGETMLSRREGAKAEQETRDRVALGQGEDLDRIHGAPTMAAGTRIQRIGQFDGTSRSGGTTRYPHLSLGPHQRLASKGGYIVKFAGSHGEQLQAESELIVP